MWINGAFGSGGKSVTSTPYLDKTAFVDPAAYTVGNIARSAPFGLFAPHNADVDLSVRREFHIRELVRLALQADAFNLNNAVHFGTPGTNIDSATFRHGDYHGQPAAQAAIQRPAFVLIRIA